MSDQPTEPTPAPVPIGATHAGEIPPEWRWVEPAVWTPRMVTALIEGVKGGMWVTSPPSRPSTNGFRCVCGVSFANVTDAVAEGVGMIMCGGPMRSLRQPGSFLWSTPTLLRVTPHRGDTTNWRAGCGRTARPVRREGGTNSIVSPYPYHVGERPASTSENARGHPRNRSAV